MRQHFIFLGLLALSTVCLAGPAQAANFTVHAGDPGGYYNNFMPSTLQIHAGDSVTWTNVSGGNHDVHADDNSFRCANGCDDTGGNGSPSTAAWSFTRTFNTAGTINYHCETHGSMGMVGSITVLASPPPQPLPGTLRFSSPNYSLSEGGGSAVITVSRTGGSDGQVSVQYATADGTAKAPGDYTAASGTLTWADHDSANKTFSVHLVDDSLVEPNATIHLNLSSPTGGADLGSPAS
ncbi:MAG TPA: Calx-beta domain-containing protein, partial [Thermoanaerobaculia bacterium]|nr:Calx-beta domain-containing protein [Thermoanaerobaculia bacterium]